MLYSCFKPKNTTPQKESILAHRSGPLPVHRYVKTCEEMEAAYAMRINQYHAALTRRHVSILNIPAPNKHYSPLPIASISTHPDHQLILRWLEIGIEQLMKAPTLPKPIPYQPIRQGQCHFTLSSDSHLSIDTVVAALRDREYELCEAINAGPLHHLKTKYGGGIDSFYVKKHGEWDIELLANIDCGGAHGATYIVEAMEYIGDLVQQTYPDITLGYRILTSAPLAGAIQCSAIIHPDIATRLETIPKATLAPYIIQLVSNICLANANDTRSTDAGLIALSDLGLATESRPYAFYKIEASNGSSALSINMPSQLTTIGLANKLTPFHTTGNKDMTLIFNESVSIAVIAMIIGASSLNNHYSLPNVPTIQASKDVLSPRLAQFDGKWRDLDSDTQRNIIKSKSMIHYETLNRIFNASDKSSTDTLYLPTSFIPIYTNNDASNSIIFIPFSGEEISVIPGIQKMIKDVIDTFEVSITHYDKGIEVTVVGIFYNGALSTDKKDRMIQGERFAELSIQRRATDGKGAANGFYGVLQALDWNTTLVHIDTFKQPDGFYQRFDFSEQHDKSWIKFRYPYTAVPACSNEMAALVGLTIEDQMKWASIIGFCGATASKNMLAGKGVASEHGNMHKRMAK